MSRRSFAVIGLGRFGSALATTLGAQAQSSYNLYGVVDLSLAFWATPLEARLSMDDVTPAGSRIAFDLEYLSTPTQPAQGAAHED